MLDSVFLLQVPLNPPALRRELPRHPYPSPPLPQGVPEARVLAQQAPNSLQIDRVFSHREGS